MNRCLDCGLLKREDDNYCVRLKKRVTEEELAGKDCPFFYKILNEAGEPLGPEEHLMLQDAELKSKKLQM